MAIAIGLGLVCLLLIIQEMIPNNNDYDDDKMDSLSLKDPGIKRSLTSLFATVAYVLLMPFLGFIASTTIYLFFLMFLLKNRAFIKMGIVSILVSVGVFLLFKTVLHITLPTGFLL
jgi:hypothetical protein